jgi:hypothetical protein
MVIRSCSLPCSRAMGKSGGAIDRFPDFPLPINSCSQLYIRHPCYQSNFIMRQGIYTVPAGACDGASSPLPLTPLWPPIRTGSSSPVRILALLTFLQGTTELPSLPRALPPSPPSTVRLSSFCSCLSLCEIAVSRTSPANTAPSPMFLRPSQPCSRTPSSSPFQSGRSYSQSTLVLHSNNN